MKRILSVLMALGAYLCASAVTLTPYIDTPTSGMNDKEVNLMLARLKSVLTRTDILPGTVNNRFAISAKAHLVEKEMTATTPIMTAVRLEITIGVGDRIDGKCYSSTVLTVKGVGDTEQKARISAIKSVRPDSPALREIVEQGATKVIDYYNQNGERLLRDADNIIRSRPHDRDSYMQAIALLADCPTDCALYDKFSEKVASIYSSWINHDARRLYTWCRAQWSKSQSADVASVVMDSLSAIEPEAEVYNDALALMDEVKNKMMEDEANRREMEWAQIEMKREAIENERDLARLRIEAASRFADKWNGKFLSIF